jgi:hypothetical protein
MEIQELTNTHVHTHIVTCENKVFSFILRLFTIIVQIRQYYQLFIYLHTLFIFISIMQCCSNDDHPYEYLAEFGNIEI